MHSFVCQYFSLNIELVNLKRTPEKFYSKFFLILLLISSTIVVNPIFADGVSWLETQTNADGSYSNSTDVSYPLQSTAEVLRAYNELEQTTQSGATAAKQYLDNLNDDGKIETLSRIVIAKSEAGENVSVLIFLLNDLQNSDGGFGDQAGYQSRVIDTAFALNALGVAKSNNADSISRAVSYLLSEQASDGGFSHSSVNQNSIYETALASIALQHFRFNYNLTAAIEGASQYLISNQIADGDWGSVWETAYALLALIPVTSDVQTYQSGVENLITAQAADGSWGQDIYATALALRAIHKAENVQVPEDPTELQM